MQIWEKYRLELHWKSVEYNRDDLAVLKGAYFEGPVLKEAIKLVEEDSLVLDMTTQHALLIPNYYQATLQWKGVAYKDAHVYLNEAYIQGRYVNSIDTLKDDDYILIDCKEHEMATHIYHLVYWAEVRKGNRESKF
jgi:hypothetical protein